MNKPLCAMVGAACLIAAGCTKKVAVKPAPAPAVQQAQASTPEKPVIELFAASPGTIDKGSETTLRWAVEHANNVRITPALGAVQESGSRAIFPSSGHGLYFDRHRTRRIGCRYSQREHCRAHGFQNAGSSH